MSEEVDNNKLKNIAIRNTESTFVAYAVPVLIYSGLVCYLGLTQTSYMAFVGLYAVCVVFITSSLIALRSVKNFTEKTGGPLLLSQLAFWLVMSHIWLFVLEEGRIGGLLFSLLMLVYTFAYGTRKMALILNTLILVGYLSVSYVAITHFAQPGDIRHELIVIAAYLPVSMFVGRVGSKLAIKKHYMRTLLEKQTQIQKELQDTLVKLDQAANTDELTKLINRREINRLLDYEYQKIQRNHSTASLVILDLDHFKLINDTYGHGGGDIVLQATARLLSNEFRVTDSVARWGGEEFIVLMPDTNQAEALAVTKRVLAKLACTLIQYDHHSLRITASGGLCQLNQDIDIPTALNIADEALYKAKASGRNQVCLQDVSEQWIG